MDNLVIRECEPEDVEGVHQLDLDWESEGVTYGFGPSSSDEIREALGPYLLVAVAEDEVIGYSRGEVHVSRDLCVFEEGERYLEIYDLYVRAPYRSARVGGKLVERMKEIAGRNGIRRFRVHSATMDLDRVLKFYRNHGFKTWCLEMFI
ncbi:MAG: GNAT family N-acetyltransferase [Gemmatimonadetes bacterium]|nr:GNAT family N-acetyltransferase [Gemmatimonadota bacterium]